MATAQTVYTQASSVYLNDAAQQIWTNTVLAPHLAEAYRDLLLVLWLNGLPVIREKSAVITVPANSASLGSPSSGPSLLPADIFEPIWLKERASGSSDSWDPMNEQDFEKDVTIQLTYLKFWAWRKEDIKFPAQPAGGGSFNGSSTARDILLQYYRAPTIPVGVTDPLGFLFAEIFLSPQTAGYAAGSVGNITLSKELLCIPGVNIGVAGSKLDQLIRANVKGQQNLPARRIPYRRFARSWYAM